MQLVAYGAQDIYLTGNPQITFFKVVYRRHTNFSMEAIEQTINGGVATGGTSTVTISRNGDLVYKIYVTNAVANTINGSAICSEIELEIGGQRIDRHYEEWNQIWNELSTPESKAIGLKSMVGDIGTAGTADSTGPLMTQYPLNFWFCRNPGLALPLIALQYHEVKLKFKWGDNANKGVTGDVKVMCDYIYLDTDERRRFAQVSHEYLIEQLQKQSAGGTGNSDKLNFNHPVKELIWTSQASSGYTTAKLKLNGHDRFSEQNAEYFQLRQPFDYHNAVPKQNLPTSAQLTTLDRQTQVVAIDRDGANDGVGSGEIVELAAVGDSGFFRDSTTNITLGLNAVIPGPIQLGNNLVKGTQISVTCTVEPGAGTATRGKLGKVYFAQLTGDAVYTTPKRITMNITALTSADEVPQVLSGPSAAAGAGVSSGKFVVSIIRNGNSGQARTSQMTDKINVYSFGLKPEEHQPSGTCNFSRIDNAQLEWQGTPPSSGYNIYAVNYNVLRIMSGMGGLAYSN